MPPHLHPAERHAHALIALGQRVRARRSAQALSGAELARRAGLSRRFVASLEAGRANISVARLLDLAAALHTTAAELIGTATEAPGLTRQRRGRLALIGLRGAGKSSIGRPAAERLGVPLVELDTRITARAGMDLGALFALHGAAYYRKLERQELQALLDDGAGPLILTTGGSIVTHEATYEQLRAECTTVFLEARPADHLERVAAQGDLRPMADRHSALDEVTALLRSRRPLYRLADHTIDTSALGLPGSVAQIVRIARTAFEQQGATA